MAEEPAAITPSLKIIGLHIAGYRSIRQLDWPEDGLGWNGMVPDIMLVGGANGSGKTTLLEGLFSVFEGQEDIDMRPVFSGAKEIRLDLRVSSRLYSGSCDLCLAIGDREFLAAQNATEPYLFDRNRRNKSEYLARSLKWRVFDKTAFDPEIFGEADLPRVLYFPSDRRLNFPEPKEYQGVPGPWKEHSGIFPPGDTIGFRYTAAQRYEDSLVALLHAARWDDLNAKEEGRPQEATSFASYVDAFHRFMGGGKALTWDHGRLLVRMNDSTLHALPELSSGEKQVLIFAAELRKAWRSGSLILIDEPELHLHEAWQSTLFELIRDLQRERGGQAILATQSRHLFGLGEPGSQVMLRKGWP